MYGFRDSEWWGLGALATPPAAISTALQNASSQYGVPVSLLQSVAQSESSYNPAAVSPKGATGLMQIMPANYSSLGVTNPLDPQQSANAGAQLLSQLYAQYGDWNTALIAYNEGSGNLAKYGAYPSSQQYAQSILANAGDLGGNSGYQTITPASPGASEGSAGPQDFSSFDLSTLDAPVSGGMSPLVWAGIAAAGLGLLWAVS